MHPKCLHCRFRPVTRPRGLCWPCYYIRSIRLKYPPLCRHGLAGARGHEEPETQEELDAIISEQMDNLPEWWEAENQKPARLDVGFKPRFTAPVRSTERRAT